MKKAGFSLLLTFCIACLTHAQQPSSLLFHLSGEEGVVADFARGSGEPHYLSQISVIDDGAAGKALRCGYKQLLTWRAPGNTGGAYGSPGLSDNQQSTDPQPFTRKEKGTQRSFHRLDRPRTGQTLVFTNDVQETPIQEFNAFYVHEGDAPAGVARLDYTPALFDDYRDPALCAIRDHILGRHRDGERQLVLAVPAGGAPARDLPQAGPDDTLCELYESNNTLPL